MSEISNIVVGLTLAYAIFVLFILGFSYITPNGTTLLTNTTASEQLETLSATSEALQSNVIDNLGDLTASSSIADLVYIAFGSVVTLLILLGQVLVSVVLLVAGLITIPFEVLENIISTAPEDLYFITQIIFGVLELFKAGLITAVSLYLLFEIVEFVGGRKP